jgi:predicted metal-dependent hydrolase
MTIIYKNSPRAKRLTIRVNAASEVVVTMPKRMNQDLASEFVLRNQAWIQNQLAKISHVERLEAEGWIYIFGQKYQKLCQYARNRPVGCFIESDTLIINPIDPQVTSKNYQKKEVDRFLKHTAQHYILPRTQQIATKMNVNFGKITLREQSSRWGSCSSAGNLNFNWRLVHFEPKVIDYVIIHELAHRVHMNHSSKFWQLVRNFDPEHALHRGVLKRFGAQLH